MRNPSGQGRRQWFWPGVSLPSISALLWVLIILRTAVDPEVDLAGVTGGGVLITFIPTGLGIYCVKNGRSKLSVTVPKVRDRPKALVILVSAGQSILCALYSFSLISSKTTSFLLNVFVLPGPMLSIIAGILIGWAIGEWFGLTFSATIGPIMDEVCSGWLDRTSMPTHTN